MAVEIDPQDHVGLTFWLITGVMWAGAFFLLFQVYLVPRQWATSTICSALVCGTAWHHYDIMLSTWSDRRAAPGVYRYMDWMITVPLQVIQFYLILCASCPMTESSQGMVPKGIFWRLLFFSSLMLAFGFLGETQLISGNFPEYTAEGAIVSAAGVDTWLFFGFGMLMWGGVVYEIFFGQAAQLNKDITINDSKAFLDKLGLGEHFENDEDPLDRTQSGRLMKQAIKASLGTSNKKVAADYAVAQFRRPAGQWAFDSIRWIFLFGWALYPIGYVIGNGTQHMNTLNALYNLADVVNKIAYVLIIFYASWGDTDRAKDNQDLAITIISAAKKADDEKAEAEKAAHMKQNPFSRFGMGGGLNGPFNFTGVVADVPGSVVENATPRLTPSQSPRGDGSRTPMLPTGPSNASMMQQNQGVNGSILNSALGQQVLNEQRAREEAMRRGPTASATRLGNVLGY